MSGTPENNLNTACVSVRSVTRGGLNCHLTSVLFRYLSLLLAYAYDATILESPQSKKVCHANESRLLLEEKRSDGWMGKEEMGKCRPIEHIAFGDRLNPLHRICATSESICTVSVKRGGGGG